MGLTFLHFTFGGLDRTNVAMRDSTRVPLTPCSPLQESGAPSKTPDDRRSSHAVMIRRSNEASFEAGISTKTGTLVIVYKTKVPGGGGVTVIRTRTRSGNDSLISTSGSETS